MNGNPDGLSQDKPYTKHGRNEDGSITILYRYLGKGVIKYNDHYEYNGYRISEDEVKILLGENKN